MNGQGGDRVQQKKEKRIFQIQESTFIIIIYFIINFNDKGRDDYDYDEDDKKS